MTSIEDKLLSLFSSVLKADGLTVDTDFFQVGGDSIKALRLIAQAEATFGLPLPMPVFFKHRTIRALAAYLESEAPAAAHSSAAGEEEYDTGLI